MAHRPATTHADLGPEFYDEVAAADFPRHILRHRNQAWATRVGLDGLTDAEWIAHFGRFEPLPGSLPQPLALRYHGHQFRHYNPDLGDGRGFLFAQLRDAQGRLLDLGTKGSGQTPWSRRGDGRLTLKGGVRENIIPDSVQLRGTIRSFDEGMRDDIHERVTTLAEAIARGNRAGCRVCVQKNYPVTVNDPALTAAMLPTLAIIGLRWGWMMSSTVLVETVFDWPGTGLYAVSSAIAGDFKPVMGVTLIIGLNFMAANLIVDLLYGVLDPRLREG
jgi:hypothetical protein